MKTHFALLQSFPSFAMGWERGLGKGPRILPSRQLRLTGPPQTRLTMDGEFYLHQGPLDIRPGPAVPFLVPPSILA